MKIGIIGAENSHAAHVAKTLNIDKKVKGFSVDYIWGETDEFAKAAAEKGGIPNIVKQPKQMLGQIDALMVDHRHAKYHLKAAAPFVEAGIPCYIDKPFCYRSDEGQKFLELANEKGVPVTSFGVVPLQSSVARFKKKLLGMGDLRTGFTYGACDLKSQWGGIFFYGIHQVELALELFGYEVKAAVVNKNGENATAELLYPNGLIVSLHLIKTGAPGFGMGAITTQGSEAVPVKMDAVQYLAGVKKFCKMFKTGERPLTDYQLLKPVRVLEALEKSVRSGQIEKIA